MVGIFCLVSHNSFFSNLNSCTFILIKSEASKAHNKLMYFKFCLCLLGFIFRYSKSEAADTLLT